MEDSGNVVLTVGSHGATAVLGGASAWWLLKGLPWNRKKKDETHEVIPRSEWEKTKEQADKVPHLEEKISALEILIDKFRTRDEQYSSAIRKILENMNDGKMTEAKAQATLLIEFISHRY